MQKIQDYLEQNQALFVGELCEYLSFASVSAQPAHKKDLQACAEWLLNRCRQIGLEANLHPTAGNPILLAQTPASRSAAEPHYLVYGHYDVQPPEPFELWRTPPFEPRLEADAIYARGASDNKGQHYAHLKAVEAFFQTDTPLPCRLTFLIEGEEEVGSSSLPSFLKKNKSLLRCDGVVISDSGIPSLKHPALTYALRGIVALEVKVKGPSRDLHSGIYGGSIENPAMALCQLLARLRDKQSRILVPGFYDQVVPLSRGERKQLKQIPFSARSYRKFLGVPALFGETGYTPTEQRTARPTVEINGLTSGYQGEGSKTIIPAWASAKLTLRLVPYQDPKEIGVLVAEHLKSLCPPTVRLEVKAGHGGEPYYISPRGAKAQAALRALKSSFGYEPLLLREGGSIPIVTEFKKVLGVDTLLLGLALPDDNPHSPNEKFSLESFRLGMLMSASLWEELAAIE